MEKQKILDEFVAIARTMVGKDAAPKVLRTASGAADGTVMFLIEDRSFRCVLQISPAAYPDVVAEGSERARAFVERIGLSLGSAVLLPLAEGRRDGRSFAILPFRAPFSSGRARWWFERQLATKPVLDWLAGLAGRADVRNDDVRGRAAYHANLVELAATDALQADIRDAAHKALQRIESGDCEPRVMPMHGDLWLGNILKAPQELGLPFSVIDWRGSEVRGYPIFDLVRLADSYRVRPIRLGRELYRHAEILGCSMSDIEVHLLAALGHYAVHRGEMTLQHYLAMVHKSYAIYRQGAACRPS